MNSRGVSLSRLCWELQYITLVDTWKPLWPMASAKQKKTQNIKYPTTAAYFTSITWSDVESRTSEKWLRNSDVSSLGRMSVFLFFFFFSLLEWINTHLHHNPCFRQWLLRKLHLRTTNPRFRFVVKQLPGLRRFHVPAAQISRISAGAPRGQF